MNDKSDSDLRKEAEGWLSSNFPRFFELYQWSNKADPRNYFNFKELFPIAYLGAQSYAQLESYLTKLDSLAWEKLRSKALPFVSADDPSRRYQQLFSTLDEARGYVFLADQGYEDIEFVEPQKRKKGSPPSPDLSAMKAGSTAILEVKTINESDACLAPDAPWRHGTITVSPNLSDEFKSKLLSTIGQARNQLDSYPQPSDRKIVLLVVRFDHGQKTSGHLYVELERFLASQVVNAGVEVYHQATL
jgi:hypothetical protein